GEPLDCIGKQINSITYRLNFWGRFINNRTNTLSDKLKSQNKTTNSGSDNNNFFHVTLRHEPFWRFATTT
ncbi:MAG: hypothetical protein QOJ54_749, partial [Aliidongia sp.]|nr:hypothetical protein [Aliidongia sp.]